MMAQSIKQIVLRIKVANSLLVIGTSIVFLAFSFNLVSSILFFFNITISFISCLVSFLASILFCFILVKKFIPQSNTYYRFWLCFLFLVTLGISTYISGCFYDVSWDGQTYHQYAIYNLSNNWNPLKALDSNTLGAEYNIWLNHYTKSSWICAASVYKLTQHIEFSKLFNWAFILSSLMFSSSAILLLQRSKYIYVFSISFIAAFNPVSIYQALSFYNDGQVSSLLLSLISTIVLSLSSRSLEKRWISVIPLILIVVVLINTKFTGLVYAFIVLVLFAIYLFVYQNRFKFYQFTLSSLLALIIGVFLIGYHPYVTNTLNQGHPFFPLAGKNSVDIITINQPISIQGKNSFYQLFISIFSQPSNYSPSHPDRSSEVLLQIPFKIEQEVLSGTFIYPDPRLGGLGPFFNTMFMLGVFLSLIFLINKPAYIETFWVIAFILCLTIFANSASWWARYAPQLYLFPLLTTVFSLNFSGVSKKLLLIIAQIILIIGLINILLISKVYIQHNLRATSEIKNFMNHLSQLHQPLLLKSDYPFWISPILRLKENHINYKLLNEESLPCKPNYIPYSGVAYCPNGG